MNKFKSWNQWEQKNLGLSNRSLGGIINGSGSGSGCPSQELEGIGIARTLLLPNIGGGDDDNDNDSDFRKVRGAASIRLGRTTAPDPLYTWWVSERGGE
mmetsp:Transcript_8092/g.23928  ORF Transcript_8092/g.23928 Transcript_8092/m.23928 type:complete len:99 (-) Transcript_8092:77-373(-)